MLLYMYLGVLVISCFVYSVIVKVTTICMISYVAGFVKCFLSDRLVRGFH